MRKGTYVDTDDLFVKVYTPVDWLFKDGTHVYIRELNNPTDALHTTMITDATTQKELDVELVGLLFLLEYHRSERDGV